MLGTNVTTAGSDVKSVVFYNFGVTVGTKTKAPYEYVWKNVPPGFYRLNAKVTDKANAVAFSDTVHVYVGNAQMGDIIGNGEFECRLWPWTLNANNGGIATFTQDPEAWIADSTAALLTIESGGTADWHVQVQAPCPIDSGHTYIFSFVAFALEPKSISVMIQENKEPWTGYFNTGTVNVDQAQEYGPFTFDCLTTDHAAYIRFNLGNNTIPIYLDQVSLIDPSITAVEERPSPSGRTLLPSNIRLDQNFPNPFNAGTTVRYSLTAGGFVALDIVDVQGRTIRRLVHERRKAGDHEAAWDGLDASSNPVPSGMYFTRLTVQASGKSETATRKLLMIK
jgi:hypothetical protein